MPNRRVASTQEEQGSGVIAMQGDSAGREDIAEGEGGIRPDEEECQKEAMKKDVRHGAPSPCRQLTMEERTQDPEPAGQPRQGKLTAVVITNQEAWKRGQ
ncbi:hypothetical protein H920_08134 [Fukomys damarensis]|uniref:Uncharacterized protein n=1 Tax=Fukomys damarensis TaxID=885580 RepID=A0A091DIU7_FUKDA|nr:hypothetical protein H920_08134 [Fukomys damarensis]